MAKSGTEKTKAAAASGGGQPKGTAAVLGRYLARNRKPSGAGAAVPMVPKPTPERAISTAIGRAAQKSCALASFPVQAKTGRSTLAEMIELLPDRALILVVENYLGLHGVVALSPGFLSAVIEMQSMGRVFSHNPPERRPTRTDASICAEFVNAALAELASELGLLGVAAGPSTFRFASFVEDPKPLELMLEDVLYHSFRLETRLGQGGAREGSFLAFLPGADMDVTVAPSDGTGTAAPTAAHAGAGRNLSEAVQAAPVMLHAVLCRKTISLRELRGLTPGASIALPFDAMARTRLETPSGQVVVTGKLGALHGLRAIRIAGQARPSAEDDADTATLPGVPGVAPGWDGDNVFSAEDDADDMPAASLFAAEPPLGDMTDPDAFRAGAEEAKDEEEAPSALALPMNFIVE